MANPYLSGVASQIPVFGFFDPARHVEALVFLAGARLSNDDPSAAFAFADRGCRVVRASAQALLLRAEASRKSGYLEFAETDLSAALEMDPTDELLNFAALRWGRLAGRSQAAQRLIFNRDCSPGVLAQAVAAMMLEGARAVPSLERKGATIEGWVAWEGAGRLELRAYGSRANEVRVLQRDDLHPLTSGQISAAGLRWSDDEASFRSVDLALDDEVVARVPVPPVSRRSPS